MWDVILDSELGDLSLGSIPVTWGKSVPNTLDFGFLICKMKVWVGSLVRDLPTLVVSLFCNCLKRCQYYIQSIHFFTMNFAAIFFGQKLTLIELTYSFLECVVLEQVLGTLLTHKNVFTIHQLMRMMTRHLCFGFRVQNCSEEKKHLLYLLPSDTVTWNCWSL